RGGYSTGFPVQEATFSFQGTEAVKEYFKEHHPTLIISRVHLVPPSGLSYPNTPPKVVDHQFLQFCFLGSEKTLNVQLEEEFTSLDANESQGSITVETQDGQTFQFVYDMEQGVAEPLILIKNQ
ncbi:MAG: hypothetical protein KDK78_07925, partial [Chlamydiia bacterium]|nr:hypothetical protein [Chlamydiia bacterium]